jgi:hypothetical protein
VKDAVLDLCGRCGALPPRPRVLARAYVTYAVTEIATLRAQLSGTQLG